MKAIKLFSVFALAALLFLSSCSESDAVFSDSDLSIERIDMVIQGPQAEHVYVQSDNSPLDLVKFNLQTQFNCLDFILTIDHERELVFSVTDLQHAEIWSKVGASYHVYPTQHFEDKQSWMEAKIISTTNQGEAISKSHTGETFPRETRLNVFQILEFNPATNEVLCRVNDLQMVQLNDNTDLAVTGTFRGRVSF